MMEKWEDFLKKLAVDYGLTAAERDIFLGQFCEANRGKQRAKTEEEFATELKVELPSYKKYKTEIFRKFTKSSRNPEGYEFGSGAGKLAKLEIFLLEKYEVWITGKDNIIPPRENLAITTIDTPAVVNSNFVGREGAFAELKTKMGQGARVIVIQAPGGVGKTTLAQEFLSSQKFEVVLDLPMAKEEANITPVESVVEEWLKRDFGEEPGRDFGVMLGRLKRQLQTKRVGVLIDNLEPALDGQGRFIAPHRRYVELLRVLADASVKSLTLITSREPLAEGLSISSYSLPCLGEEAWANFFCSRGIEVEATILKEIHRAYGGNALAMTILCDPIQRDGGMGAYWQEHKIEAGLFVELAVENLVKEQFDRLEKISPEAYRLLRRLGCYRYQDIPRISTDGLLCLLWDVSEVECRRVIESLRSWSLVECNKGEYWLHPVVLAEAISRLRESGDWKIANQTAAAFWTESVKTVETVEDAQRALEAYYHYFEIHEYEKACMVILERRDSRWRTKLEGGEPLDASFYRLGLFQEIIIASIEVTNKISLGYYITRLYEVIAIGYESLGDIKKAIGYAIEFKRLAQKYSFYELEADAIKLIGRCQMYLGEINKAVNNFEEAKVIYENQQLHRNTIISSCYLAFLKTLIGPEINKFIIHNLIKESCTGFLRSDLSIWRKGYGVLYVGLAYKNMREFENALEMYYKAIKYSEDSNFTQLKGMASYSLAEVYREKSEFEIALSHHEESIELLEKIGAKCDLAEAYYQLALTYQAMGKPDQSQEYFAKAIQLYEEMEAPKQVEKVRRAMLPPSPPTLPRRQSL